MRNRKIAFLFDCLVEHHKTYCVKEDCPSRKKYTKTKHLAKIFKEDYEDENLIMIVHFLESSFSIALEKLLKFSRFFIHLKLDSITQLC